MYSLAEKLVKQFRSLHALYSSITGYNIFEVSKDKNVAIFSTSNYGLRLEALIQGNVPFEQQKYRTEPFKVGVNTGHGNTSLVLFPCRQYQ